MRLGRVLAGMLILSGTVTVAQAASAGQGGVVTGEKAAATGARYSYRPNPSDFYPVQSRNAGKQGLARTRVCYDITGRVDEASLKDSSGSKDLDEVAVRESRDVRISPGTLDGVRQAGCVIIPWRLSLPELISMPGIKSIYPQESKKLGEEGMAAIAVCYDAKGKPVSSELHSSSGFQRLDEAAVLAGKKFRFKPPTIHGAKQMGCSVVPLEFKPKR